MKFYKTETDGDRRITTELTEAQARDEFETVYRSGFEGFARRGGRLMTRLGAELYTVSDDGKIPPVGFYGVL